MFKFWKDLINLWSYKNKKVAQNRHCALNVRCAQGQKAVAK